MTDLPEKGARRPDPMAFGRALPQGLGLNLLVADVEASARFAAAVLTARVLYWEDAFAVVTLLGATWQLHSDWSYRNHEMRGLVEGAEARGAGAEFRLYGLDPDETVSRALSAGAIVLSAALDRPHGLREAHVIDPDGYVWVPSVPLREA